MNTLIIAFFAVVAVAAAAPPANSPEEPIPIIKQSSDLLPDGSYVSEFETGNGIKQFVQGRIEGEGKDASPFVEGFYSYPGADGSTKKISYTAGKDGFIATGDDIPVGPETPAYIIKSLEWSAAHPHEEKEEEKAV